ncbi:hypothetical protein ACIQXQ_05265 [Peribacillus sp. NPDC097198]|uniref:hypothetical protein n=1 Tax=Peribacillus sp. NPDC097198 TaxID=3364397 RepID=UPI00382BCF78
MAEVYDSKSCSFWSVGSTPATGINTSLANAVISTFSTSVGGVFYLSGIYYLALNIVRGQSYAIFMARRSNRLEPNEIKVVASDIIPDRFNFDELLYLFLHDANLRNLRSHTLRYCQNELTSFRKSLGELEFDLTQRI